MQGGTSALACGRNCLKLAMKSGSVLMDYCFPPIAVRPNAANIYGRARGSSRERLLAGQCHLLQSHGMLCRRRSCSCQKPSVGAEAGANLTASALQVLAAVLPRLGCRACSQSDKQRSEAAKPCTFLNSLGMEKRELNPKWQMFVSRGYSGRRSGMTAVRMVQESV